MDQLLIDHWPIVKWAATGLMGLAGGHVWWMLRRIEKKVDRIDNHETRIVVLETVCRVRRKSDPEGGC